MQIRDPGPELSRGPTGPAGGGGCQEPWIGLNRSSSLLYLEQPNPRTASPGPGCGPYRVRLCFWRVRVGLQAMRKDRWGLLKIEVLKMEVIIGLKDITE